MFGNAEISNIAICRTIIEGVCLKENTFFHTQIKVERALIEITNIIKSQNLKRRNSKHLRYYQDIV